MQNHSDNQGYIVKEFEVIDKWCAKQCGVETRTLDGFQYLTEYGWEAWYLEDPRCREIVREHFKICTVYDEEGHWKAYAFKPHVEPNRKTLAEAEIACITAIWEAQHGSQ